MRQNRLELKSRSIRALPAAALVAALAGFTAFVGAGAASTGGERAAAAPAGSGLVNTSSPIVSGTAQEGRTLSTTTGDWRSSTPLTFSFNWRRCNASGTDCPTTIPGATSSTYMLTATDVGHSLRSVVSASGSSGRGSSVSAPTAVVAAPGGPLVNVASPSVSGTPVEGETLTTTSGDWRSSTPVTFTYAWRRCNPQGTDCPLTIPGATQSTYQVSAADVGHSLRSVVTAATNSARGSTLSAPTAVIQAKAPAGGTAGGAIAISEVSLPNRLVISRVEFSPRFIRTRGEPVIAQFRVSEARGRAVAGALVYVVGLPFGRITQPPEVRTDANGIAEITLSPTALLPFKRGASLVLFVRARKAGDSLLAGVSTRRLVQIVVIPA